MSTPEYTSPVNKLLTIGKPESVKPDKWPNYLELGLTLEDIPELIRMATDRKLRDLEEEEYEDEDTDFWAPIHAIRALGQLHAESNRQLSHLSTYLLSCTIRMTNGCWKKCLQFTV